MALSRLLDSASNWQKHGAKMITKPKTKRQELDAAKAQYDQAARMLRAHETLWQDIWEAEPSPFKKIKQLRSEKQTKMRAPIIGAWLDAKKQYQDLAKAYRS